MRVRKGSAGDDAALLRLMSQVAMPGSAGISYRYHPPFSGSLEAQGYDPRTLVGERCGEVVAAATVTRRRVYLEGKPAEVGYLASLRIAPQARGSLLLARGYRLLAGLQQEELRLPFYLTSIMRSNQAALSLLTSGRGGLPPYHLLGGYKTAAIPVFRSYPAPQGVTVAGGEEAGIGRILCCLERYGSMKDLCTVYEPGDLAQGKGMLKGLRVEDFLVATRGGEPVGVIALWDHSSFRQLVLHELTGTLRLAALLDKLVARFTGRTLLPEPEEPFAPRFLSCVAIRENDPAIFHALLAAAVTRMRRRGEKLLIAGFFESDRLCEVLGKFFHLPFYSNIYAVDWGGGAAAAIKTGRPLYLDPGSL